MAVTMVSACNYGRCNFKNESDTIFLDDYNSSLFNDCYTKLKEYRKEYSALSDDEKEGVPGKIIVRNLFLKLPNLPGITLEYTSHFMEADFSQKILEQLRNACPNKSFTIYKWHYSYNDCTYHITEICNFNDQPCQSCEFCSEANPADWGMSRFSEAKMNAEKTLTNTTLSI